MKLRQYFVKLKISKSFNTGKWERCIEYFARLFVLASVIVLAMWTIFTSPLGITWFAKAFLIIFISAAAIVFYFEARHLFRKQPSNQQESTQIPTDIERAGRNKWISIGLLVLVVIILVPILARQLLPDSLEYQAFLTAFAATGAWVTGIAIVVFAYYQYKLRQTEHSLLFNPQLLLSSSAPITGEAVYNNRKYPYRIEWSVFIQNTSSVPIIIEHMAIKVKSARGDLGREEYIPYDCYFILEPYGLEPPFQVTIAAPQRIKYVIEGRDMAQVLDYVAGNSKSRVFELIFKVRATIPQGHSTPTIMERDSIPFIVPENAKWGNSTPWVKSEPIF